MSFIVCLGWSFLPWAKWWMSASQAFQLPVCRKAEKKTAGWFQHAIHWEGNVPSVNQLLCPVRLRPVHALHNYSYDRQNYPRVSLGLMADLLPNTHHDKIPICPCCLVNHSPSNILWKGGIKGFISHSKVLCGTALPWLLYKCYWKSSVCVEEEKRGARDLPETQVLIFLQRKAEGLVQCFIKTLNLQLLDHCPAVSYGFIRRICVAIEVKQKKKPPLLYLIFPQA